MFKVVLDHSVAVNGLHERVCWAGHAVRRDDLLVGGVRRRLTSRDGRWRRPSADGVELFNIASVPVTRYRYRGVQVPNPWTMPDQA